MDDKTEIKRKKMSNNKQSSVDKFVEAIMKHDKSFKEFYGAEIEELKAMHKEEIIKSWDLSRRDIDYPANGEQYYKEIYGDKQ